MSISKKPNGKEGGLGRTTSTSGPFDGNGPTLAFRGGNKTSTDSIKDGRYYAPPGEPIWFSPRKEIASNYGDSLLEADLSSLRFLEDGSPEFSRLNPTNISIKKQEFHDLLTKAGYDGLKMGNGDFAVFNPAAIKRISSPSIPKELEGLAAEARKYKSTGEFKKAVSGNQGIYAKDYEASFDPNRASAKPFDYDLMERAFGTTPETKGDLVKIYRLTTNGRILPGDNVSIYNLERYRRADGGADVTAAKMGITQLYGNPDVKMIEQWIPKKDLYQTSAGTQLYAPDGMKSLTDFFNKVKGIK